MKSSTQYPGVHPTVTILSSILTPERIGQTGVLCPAHPRSGVGMMRVVFPDGEYEYFGSKEVEVNHDICQPVPPHGLELTQW